MKKIVCLCFIFLLVLSLHLFAAGQKDAARDWKTESLTIRLESLAWILNKFPVADAANRFMKDHPNIKVQVNANQDGSLKTYLLNWSTENVEVDVAFGGDAGYVAPLAYKGLLEPWNEFYKGDYSRDHFITFVTELPKIKEGYYATPLMVEGMALEANKKMMVDAGLASNGKPLYPKNLEELYTFAKKLTKGTGDIKDVFGFSWNFSVFGADAFFSAVQSQGGKAFNTDGSPNFDEPQIVTIFDFIKRVTADGWGSKSTMTDGNAGRAGLMARKVAIIYESSARTIEAKEKIGDESTILPFPGQVEKGSFIYSHYAYVPKGCKVKDAVYAFMREQVFAKEFAEFGAEKFGKLPSMKKLYDGLGPDFNEIRKWINNSSTIGSLPWVDRGSLDSLLFELEQTVVTSGMTAKEAAQQLKERAAKLNLNVVK